MVQEANVYISANVLTDIYYLLRKDYGSDAAQDMIEKNLSFLQVVGVSPEDAKRALSLRWSNFEDCLVAQCAEKIKADYIVTRNVKDFKASSVEAITPEELFVRLKDQGCEYEEVAWWHGLVNGFSSVKTIRRSFGNRMLITRFARKPCYRMRMIHSHTKTTAWPRGDE